MKIASWVTPEGLAGDMWPADHGLSTTAIQDTGIQLYIAIDFSASLAVCQF